jgi:peptide/nickel transport system permease protein
MPTAVNRKMRTERSAFYNLLSRLYHDPLGFFGLILVVIVVSSAIFADWIVPYDPIAINIQERLQGPSVNHLMGTDQLADWSSVSSPDTDRAGSIRS